MNDITPLDTSPLDNLLSPYQIERDRACPGSSRPIRKGTVMVRDEGAVQGTCDTCDRVVHLSKRSLLILTHNVPKARYMPFRTRLRVRWHTFLRAAQS